MSFLRAPFSVSAIFSLLQAELNPHRCTAGPTMKIVLTAIMTALAVLEPSSAFTSSMIKQKQWTQPTDVARSPKSHSALQMGLFDYIDPRYWKRQYIVAAMLSRQVPLSAGVVCELFPADGKNFFYYPGIVGKCNVGNVPLVRIS